MPTDTMLHPIWHSSDTYLIEAYFTASRAYSFYREDCLGAPRRAA